MCQCVSVYVNAEARTNQKKNIRIENVIVRECYFVADITRTLQPKQEKKI